MKKLNEDVMKSLSFPDFAVEKMELFPQEKILKISVEGALLDVEEGAELGRGVLIFKEWKSLSIRRFDSETKMWSLVELNLAEPLRDLCEVKFFDNSVSLSGFGKHQGSWLEWTILNAKMYAEFEP